MATKTSSNTVSEGLGHPCEGRAGSNHHTALNRRRVHCRAESTPRASLSKACTSPSCSGTPRR